VRLLTVKDVGLIESEEGGCENAGEAALGQSAAKDCDDSNAGNTAEKGKSAEADGARSPESGARLKKKVVERRVHEVVANSGDLAGRGQENRLPRKDFVAFESLIRVKRVEGLHRIAG
jgi:hypothetical protein